jgi:riboflavin kinase/FMN adenylyltransferase
MAVPFVARSLDDIHRAAPRGSAVTLGVFDGVHLGHQRIIDELVHARKRPGIHQCYLVTFDPHPLVVTHSRMTPPTLTTIEERVALLSRYDLDGILVLRFDEHLAGLDYRVFLERYLIRPFDMKHLVLGYDCHFGRNREGSPERVVHEAPKHGLSATVVPALVSGGEIISSTRIRNALIEGDLETANALLGHPYLLSGVVGRGHGMGRGLGFPTANLTIVDPFKLWPPRGVYAVRVDIEGHLHDGMMNIGRAPTMKSLPEEAREAEVHLFEFEGDLYDEHLFVYCCAYLRNERKFAAPAELAAQLARDATDARRRLGSCAPPAVPHPGSQLRRGRADGGRTGGH